MALMNPSATGVARSNEQKSSSPSEELSRERRMRFVIVRGMKIAQLVVAPCLHAELMESAELPPSSRGPGGFGSTGK